MNTDLAVAFSAFFIICKKVKNKKKLRSQWVRRLYRHRTDNLLLREMDHIHLKNFTRMTSEDFEELIKLIGPIIQKKNTKLRKAIPVKDRLALTLRFLASGDSFTSLQYLFKISKQSISVIVAETCSALTLSLKDQIKVRNNIYFYNQSNINILNNEQRNKKIKIYVSYKNKK